jgi:hypothetical protein
MVICLFLPNSNFQNHEHSQWQLTQHFIRVHEITRVAVLKQLLRNYVRTIYRAYLCCDLRTSNLVWSETHGLVHIKAPQNCKYKHAPNKPALYLGEYSYSAVTCEHFQLSHIEVRPSHFSSLLPFTVQICDMFFSAKFPNIRRDKCVPERQRTTTFYPREELITNVRRCRQLGRIQATLYQ